ncbi:Oidioi.mRNA.OKI2018_I69.XSR.g14342.t1.cds [Oikopleura dioica]|uniref:Oidioi.mRNA.OKI2018_I69.XSR.g14342.t1.cds n=1 Tax=Oikopleura dioica TaxID=34765 RepID=A0ABN7SBA8_OIKDI|nr:Oidioi.mRNA.OKI2018_I69.XSR.g14342.t1.cds [Oikopleura dioica]
MRIEISAPDDNPARPSYGLQTRPLSSRNSNISIRSGKALAGFKATLEESEKRAQKSNTNLGNLVFTNEPGQRSKSTFLQSGAQLSVSPGRKSAFGGKRVSPKNGFPVVLEVKESQAQKLKKIRFRMLYCSGLQYTAIFATSILMILQGVNMYISDDNKSVNGVGSIASGIILIMIPFYCGYLLLSADTQNNRALRKQKKKENKSIFIQDKQSDESLWSNFSI